MDNNLRDHISESVIHIHSTSLACRYVFNEETYTSAMFHSTINSPNTDCRMLLLSHLRADQSPQYSSNKYISICLYNGIHVFMNRTRICCNVAKYVNNSIIFNTRQSRYALICYRTVGLFVYFSITLAVRLWLIGFLSNSYNLLNVGILEYNVKALRF